jgi:DNA repair protein RAD51
MGFITAEAVILQRSNRCKITTGSREIDNILAGGVASSNITEVTGLSATGKTQFCHTLAVTCQVRHILKFLIIITVRLNFKFLATC